MKGKTYWFWQCPKCGHRKRTRIIKKVLNCPMCGKAEMGRI